MKSTRVRSTRQPDPFDVEPPVVIGKFRPGIKVLTKAAAKNHKLVDLYERGLAAEASFDDIAAAMQRVEGCPKYPLVPKEVPYFRVVQSDFREPGAAKKIIDAYGEVRHGDTEKRVYSFPSFFMERGNDPRPVIDQVWEEYFVAFDRSGRHRWSQVLEEGGDVMCMKYADADDKARRRTYGGRTPEVVEKCHPNTCPLFQAERGVRCVHKGKLYFHVPVLAGTAPLSMEFTSVYAKLGIGPQLEEIQAGLGRITGTYKGQALFRVSKTRERVSHFNPQTGASEKSGHWIIGLSSPINLFELSVEREKALLQKSLALEAPEQPAPEPQEKVVPQEPEQAVQQEPEQAVQQEPEQAVEHEPEQAVEEEITVEPEPIRDRDGTTDPVATSEPDPEPDAEPAAKAEATTIKALRLDIDKARTELGWTAEELKQWVAANEKWPKNALRIKEHLMDIWGELDKWVKREAADNEPDAATTDTAPDTAPDTVGADDENKQDNMPF